LSSNLHLHPATAPLPLMAGRNYRCQCGQPVFFRNSKCLACSTPLGYDCERALLLPLMAADGADDAAQADPAQGIALWQAWRPQTVALAAGGSDAGDPAPSEPPPDNPNPPLLEDIPGQQSGSSAAATSPPANLPPVALTGRAPAAGNGTGAPLYKRCLNLSTPASCNWLVAAHDPLDMCRACRLNRTIPDLAEPAQPDNGYLWGLVELAKRRLVSSLITLQLPVASRMSARASDAAGVRSSNARKFIRGASG